MKSDRVLQKNGTDPAHEEPERDPAVALPLSEQDPEEEEEEEVAETTDDEFEPTTDIAESPSGSQTDQLSNTSPSHQTSTSTEPAFSSDQTAEDKYEQYQDIDPTAKTAS